MRISMALVACLVVATAHAQEAVVRKMSEAKRIPTPALPACVTVAEESGDPAKGPSVLLFTAKTGCKIPWHWHTATESVMMVSGSARLEMKDKGSATLVRGSYALLPSKHVHQFNCVTNCTAFISSDAAFDINYVDAAGKEIMPDEALGKKK